MSKPRLLLPAVAQTERGFLAVGAVGQGDATPTSDGDQSNWLHFTTLSLGTTLDSRI